MFDDKFLEKTIQKALGDPEIYYIPMGITRYDFAKMHGWWLRIRRDEAPFQKFFYDSHFLSISDSLRAAIEYRHVILSSFPLEKKIKRRPTKKLPSDPELRIKRKIEKGKKQPYISWQAVWYDENHEKKSNNFSVLKFGEDGARKLALERARDNHNKSPMPISEAVGYDPYKKQKFRPTSRQDVSAQANVDGEKYSSTESEIIAENSFPYAFEGQRNLTLHISLERDRNLRNLKVQEFHERNGAIYCEVCFLNFTKQYPFLIKDIIEVHHMIPLSKLSGSTKTTLNDLILLCANCHLAIHQGDEEENLLKAIELFDAKHNENQT